LLVRAAKHFPYIICHSSLIALSGEQPKRRDAKTQSRKGKTNSYASGLNNKRRGHFVSFVLFGEWCL